MLPNGYIYYATEWHWDNDKQRTIDNRKIIGKRDQEHQGMMFPNTRYWTFFDDHKADSDIEARSEQPGTRDLKTAGSADINLSYAPFVVLKKTAELIGALGALQEAFPKLWRMMLAVAVHAIVGQSSTAQHFPYWAFRNWCGLDTPPSDSTISRMYREISDNTGRIELFFSLYRAAFQKAFPASSERVIAFDSTNQTTESRGLKNAQRGKAKTGEKLPIVNTAMYVDEIIGISLWYEHFDGSVLDKSQSVYSIEKAKQLGFKKLFLMMDRGFYSDDNAHDVSSMDIGFAMMIPETATFVSQLITRWRDELNVKAKRYIVDEDIYGLQTEVTLPSGARYYAYVYFDDNTASDERKAINAHLHYFLSQARQRKRCTEKMRSFFGSRGIIVSKDNADNTERNFTLKVNRDMLQSAYNEAGFFVILSNRLMDAERMIHIARGRDCVEKAFKDLKSHFDLSRTYMHSDETYYGKMFTAFFALVLLQGFRWFIHQTQEFRKSDTIPTLLGELSKYTIMLKDDGTYMPVYAMNKKQKVLLKAVSLTEEQIEASARSLKNNRL